jgi:hypothetical protein
MEFNSEYIKTKFAKIDQNKQEPELTLLEDLQNILSPEKFNQGVLIDFGNNRQALENVLNGLELDKMLDAHTGSMHIHNAVVYTRGTTSFVGRSIEQLKKLPILDAVDALQADRWHLEYDGTDKTFPRICIKDPIVRSWIVLGHKKEVDDKSCSDPALPGIVIGSTYRYLPEFDVDEWDDEIEELNYYWRANFKERDDTGVSVLASYMALNGLKLLMPDRSYYFMTGKLLGMGPMRSVGGVLTKHAFELKSGKLSLVAPSEKQEEDL